MGYSSAAGLEQWAQQGRAEGTSSNNEISSLRFSKLFI